MRIIFKKIIIYILQIEARLVLKKYKPKVIAITGSVGKTSTKDLIYTIFSAFTYVRKSEKSYNSQIGLPLTILGIPNGWNNPYIWFKNILKGLWLILYTQKYPTWLILEVGVGKPGDMKETASWLQTDAVIITAIGEMPAHIEFFDSRKHLIEEKSGLIKTLKKEGLLVLNADDEASLEMKNKTKNRFITYGFRNSLSGVESVDILGSGENIFYSATNEPLGVIFRIDENGKSLPVVMEGVFGKNHLYAALAGLALVSGLKFDMLQAINMIKNYDAPAGRMKLLYGINDSLLIDDTYNSSPQACLSALQTVKEIKTTGRKIAVLGDMLELGKHTEEAHRNIGTLVKKVVDILFVVGPRAQFIKTGAVEVGMKEKNILEFKNAVEAGEYLETFIKDRDLILLKASQGVRMERTVEIILKDKENKEKLLVRQNKEWLTKK